MLKDKPCGVMVIEDDVGNVGDVLMAGDGNGRNRVLLVNGGVNGNDAFDAAGEKQLGIRAHEFVVMAVGDGEKKEIVLAEEGFDAADDRCAVSIADFLGDDADGVAALDAERTREEIRAIVELVSGLDDAIAGAFGDGAGGGRIVENTGNGSRRKVEMQSERLESNCRRLRGVACLSRFFHGVMTSLRTLRNGRSTTTILTQFCQGGCKEIEASESDFPLQKRLSTFYLDIGAAYIPDSTQKKRRLPTEMMRVEAGPAEPAAGRGRTLSKS